MSPGKENRNFEAKKQKLKEEIGDLRGEGFSVSNTHMEFVDFMESKIKTGLGSRHSSKIGTISPKDEALIEKFVKTNISNFL
jgi:hypothetical protein